LCWNSGRRDAAAAHPYADQSLGSRRDSHEGITRNASARAASRFQSFATELPSPDSVFAGCVAAVARLDASSKIKLDQCQLVALILEALRSHPALAHVERISIARLYGGEPNWDIASITPELSSGQYLAVQEVVSGLRFLYSLHDGDV